MQNEYAVPQTEQRDVKQPYRVTAVEGPATGFDDLRKEFERDHPQQAYFTGQIPKQSTPVKPSYVMATMSRLHREHEGVLDAIENLESALLSILSEDSLGSDKALATTEPRSALHGELLAACNNAWSLEQRIRGITERLTL